MIAMLIPPSLARSTAGEGAGGGGWNMELWVMMAIAFVMFLVLLVLVVIVVMRLYFLRGAKRRGEHKSLPSASPSNAASPSGVLEGSLVLRSGVLTKLLECTSTIIIGAGFHGTNYSFEYICCVVY